MKILIVEDEIKTGEYLSKGLTEAGFVVDQDDAATSFQVRTRPVLPWHYPFARPPCLSLIVN